MNDAGKLLFLFWLAVTSLGDSHSESTWQQSFAGQMSNDRV